MNKFRFLTAGESHGPALNTIIEGVPAGLEISEDDVAKDMLRRQRGYGRGDRMKIETDRAQIMAGVRYGKALGSPISLMLHNKDWPNWTEKMSITPVKNPTDKLQMPRPGHADFAGMVKFQHDDLRNLLERSSARETAMRVAVGAVARKILSNFGIQIWGHVKRIGFAESSFTAVKHTTRTLGDLADWKKTFDTVENSPMACADEAVNEKMIKLVDDAKEEGTSLGGTFEIIATGLPIGLGSHVHWDKKLDAHLAYAMMSINAMKSVEIGMGTGVAEVPGKFVHDEIFHDENGFYRKTNNAGGLEGGMTNGEPLVVSVAMKPLPTMVSPLSSVDVNTKNTKLAHYERADVCAVPAAVVVGEAMMAIILVNALMDKIGGDSINEMLTNFKNLPNAPLDW